MRRSEADRARLEHVAKLFVILVAGFCTLVSLFAFTCTGWGVESNSLVMLAGRQAIAMITPWSAVHFIGRDRYPASAGAMVAAGFSFLWLETGWGFVQPSSGFSVISSMPFAAAGVGMLVHLVRLDASSRAPHHGH